MSVLPGEGTHVILYGTVSIAARTQIHQGYLARPDLAGTYPTVIMLPGMGGITSGTKALARNLARYGLAIVIPDLYRGQGPARRSTVEEQQDAYRGLSDSRARADLGDVYRFLGRAEWAEAWRLGLLGLGTGGRLALLEAAEQPSVVAVAVAYSRLTNDPWRRRQASEVLRDFDTPLLGLYGKADDELADQPSEGHALAPSAEWVVYDRGQQGFLDEGADTYDEGIAGDAIERLVEFFARSLGRIAAAEEG